MSRLPRKQSASSVYHVIIRGVAKQIIFENDEDRAFFMTRTMHGIEDVGGQLFAWCLMDNHVHLLVKLDFAALSTFMHGLQTAYAGYFNRVYGRTGALFEGRFKSEPVETDDYLKTVVRYIHRNPAKAGLARDCSFPWSSFGEYATGIEKWTNTDFVLEIFQGREAFLLFHGNETTDSRVMDIAENPRVVLSDAGALRMAMDLLGEDGLRNLKSSPRNVRDQMLVLLKDAGLSTRQIQRMTGIAVSVISRASRE